MLYLLLSNIFKYLFNTINRIKLFLKYNLTAIIFDNTALLTNSRRNLKNYSYFHFIYNGAKTSSDPKVHYELSNLFIETYILISSTLDNSYSRNLF